MPAFQGGPSPHRWNQIRKLPIQPGIRSLRDYEEAVMIGQMDSLAFLREIDVLQGFGSRDIQHVHHLIFHRVHPWAGQFRTPEQMATVSGYPTADSHRISRELELALVQHQELLQLSTKPSPHEKLRALAFFHVRFERIHPFLDGNGRTGRAILAAQIENIFGTLPTFGNQPGYRAGIRASGSNDLGPFVHFLCTELNLPPRSGPWPSSFKLAPRFLEADASPSFDQDLSWSKLPV